MGTRVAQSPDHQQYGRWQRHPSLRTGKTSISQDVQDVETWQVPGAAVTTGPGAAVVTGAAGVVATVSEKESMDFYCTSRVGQFQFWASASLGLLNFFVQLQVTPLYLEQGRRRRSIPRRRLQ